MERLGGFTADAVVGKTVEEVFASYHGLPIGEFADEVERQGTIALRKHQLHTEDGREFHQYIKGQVFYNHKGEDKGSQLDERRLMLITFLTNQRSRIIPTLSQRIRQTIPAYGDMPAEELQKRVTQGVDAFLEALRADDLAPLEQFIADTVAPRTVEEFPLALLHAAFTAFGEMLPSLLHECYGDDLANILTDLQRLHLLKDAILMRLVTQYETEAQTIFRKRQAEQRAYRAQLEEQLERFIADTVAPRTVEEFPLALLHAAFTAFGEMLPSLLH